MSGEIRRRHRNQFVSISIRFRFPGHIPAVGKMRKYQKKVEMSYGFCSMFDGSPFSFNNFISMCVREICFRNMNYVLLYIYSDKFLVVDEYWVLNRGFVCFYIYLIIKKNILYMFIHKNTNSFIKNLINYTYYGIIGIPSTGVGIIIYVKYYIGFMQQLLWIKLCCICYDLLIIFFG